MILAAGRGERMRPLTDTTPKPLLQAGGKPLIVWHIERLVAAGITQIIINHAWLGEQIEEALGDGARYGAQLRYSPEPVALETAGGIAQALPFFGGQPFLVINGDIWCDWDPAQAPALADALKPGGLVAWLVMVDNPAQHPQGDFTLGADGFLQERSGAPTEITLTFSGIGVYHPDFFEGVPEQQAAALAPLLRSAMRARRVGANHYFGTWADIGTPERLQALNASLAWR
jgi:MurNAc alpha-1-phosphate uridylyltransferase